MRRTFRLYPFLLVTASILVVYTYSGAYDFASPLQMVIPYCVEILISGLFYALSYWLLKDARIAAVSVSLLAILFFFRLELSLIVIGLILVLIYFRWKKKIWDWVIAELYLKWTSIAFLVIYFVMFVYLEIRIPFCKLKELASQPIAVGQVSSRPDIYYIILDGYGSAEALREYYGYDNQEFISGLESRGFFIASDAMANYPRTILSLGSSLNLEYLDNYTSVMGSTEYWWPILDTLHHSRLRNFLEEQGYSTIFIDSGWDYTTIPDGSRYLSAYPLALTEFEDVWIRQTNLKIITMFPDLGLPLPTYATHRRITDYAFTELGKAAEIAGPKFIFVHIIPPHPPFVFDQDGRPVDPSYPYTLFDGSDFPGSATDYKLGYVDQLIYVNRRMTSAIDAILNNSRSSPIIIIQADHGPGLYTDFTSAQNTCLNERFSILDAYYLPVDHPVHLTPEITPVNSFRLILDAYFGTGLGELPNRQYFSSRDRLYQFQDVTLLSSQTCTNIK